MKIAMVLPSLEECGPFLVVKNIIRSISPEKCSFLLISLRPVVSKEPITIGLHCVEIVSMQMGKFPTWRTIALLEDVVKRYEVDVLHAHCFWPSVLVSFLNKRVIVGNTLHNNPLEDFCFTYGKVIGYSMMKLFIWAINRVHFNVAISRYVGDAHKGHGLKKDPIVVYNGVEDEGERESHQVGNVLNLVTVANLCTRKNHEFAIDVIKHLVDIGVKAEYHLFGDGPRKELLKERAVKSGIARQVIFYGHVSHDQMAKKITKMDVCIFPTLSEGFGLAVVESMMRGIPVVTNDLPVMRELITNQQDGYLCEKNNVDAYIQCIEALRLPSKYQAIVKSARLTYEKNFTCEKMAEQYMAIWEMMRG